MTSGGSAYFKLHDALKRHLEQRGWTNLWPVQEDAFSTISQGHGALIVSQTASGKTEAAFLPALNAVLTQKLPPISVLYVAPLRALINDQYDRLELLARDCNLRVAKWHSDVAQSIRSSVHRTLPDILLTTPESLETILDSGKWGHGIDLRDVHYVIVDEVHAFADDDRGAHLASLLERLQGNAKNRFIRIGLSATVGAPESVAEWLQGTERPGSVRVVGHTRLRDSSVDVLYLPNASALSTVKALVAGIANKKTIVFANSRREVEALAVAFSDCGMPAVVHHGSMHREQRLEAEKAFRRQRQLTIIATSTLELGIDIGDLDCVVQIGPTATVSSFAQRLGRSGRRSGTARAILVATDEGTLLQCLGLSYLIAEGKTESVKPGCFEAHILVHQILALSLEREKADLEGAWQTLHGAFPFRDVNEAHYRCLLKHLEAREFLRQIRSKYTAGCEMERRFGHRNFRDFIAVFDAREGFAVKWGNRSIGFVDPSFALSQKGLDALVLGGQRWRVLKIDNVTKIISVAPADNARLVSWNSEPQAVSFLLARGMARVVEGMDPHCDTAEFATALQRIRLRYRQLSFNARRICVYDSAQHINVLTFAGHLLNMTIGVLLAHRMGIHFGVSATRVTVSSPRTDVDCDAVAGQLRALKTMSMEEVEELLRSSIRSLPKPYKIGKYFDLLPPSLQEELLIHKLVDASGLHNFLATVDVVYDQPAELNHL